MSRGKSNVLARGRQLRASSPGAVAFRRFVYEIYLACAVGLNVVLLVPRDESGGSLVSGIYTQSWAALYVLVLLALFSLRRALPTALIIALALSTYICLSALWSVAPDETVRSALALVSTILVAYTMAVDLSSAETLRLVAQVITVLIIAGIIAYFLGLQLVYYIDAHERPNYLGLTPMRGFFTHKITGSLYAVMGMVAAVISFRGWKRNVAVGSAVLFVLLAGSATGVVLAIAAGLTFVIVFWARSRRTSLVSIFLLALPALAAIGIFSASRYSEILNLMGRDETLTGRTELWEAGLQVWGQSPIIGWGLNAYLSSPISNWIQLTYGRFQNYDVPNFHSSYVQTAVDLGAIGLIVLVLVLARGTWTAGRQAISGSSSAAAGVFVMHVVWLIAAPFMILFLKGHHPATLMLFVFFFQTFRPPKTKLEGQRQLA